MRTLLIILFVITCAAQGEAGPPAKEYLVKLPEGLASDLLATDGFNAIYLGPSNLSAVDALEKGRLVRLGLNEKKREHKVRLPIKVEDTVAFVTHFGSPLFHTMVFPTAVDADAKVLTILPLNFETLEVHVLNAGLPGDTVHAEVWVTEVSPALIKFERRVVVHPPAEHAKIVGLQVGKSYTVDLLIANRSQKTNVRYEPLTYALSHDDTRHALSLDTKQLKPAKSLYRATEVSEKAAEGKSAN